MNPSRISADAFMDILRKGMPSAIAMDFEVVTLDEGQVTLRMRTDAKDLRPGGTVSGPVLFAVADLALYAAVMSVTGPVALAVTTDATVHFLRRASAGELLVHARILKQGKVLIVGEATIIGERQPEAPVAHFVMTYSVPPPERVQGA